MRNKEESNRRLGGADVVREEANQTDGGGVVSYAHVNGKIQLHGEEGEIPATLRSEARLSRVADCLKAVEQWAMHSSMRDRRSEHRRTGRHRRERGCQARSAIEMQHK